MHQLQNIQVSGPSMAQIFNNAQNVQTSESALIQLKKVYKALSFKEFDSQFRDCVRKLLQTKHTHYFKTSCDFLCDFLKYVSKIPESKTSSTPAPKKRKSSLSTSSTIGKVTDHDRIVSTCMDVADLYMNSLDEECRLNAVFFVSKFINKVDSLDEMICKRLKETLPKRVRDKKPMIRAHAVLASRTFQDSKMTQENFLHHYQFDPEIMVRKALLTIMDTKIFGYDFLIESTQDNVESMRKVAFNRLGKVCPKDLDSKQLHRVIHNGLNERERQASYTFKAQTLEPWLTKLYDGIDLHELLQSFDVINHNEVVCRLLELIYERNLEDSQANGTTTKLHQVVESFRVRWFSNDNLCLPNLNSFNENISTVWVTLVKFCRANQAIIKPIRIRTVEPDALNESIEKIIDSQTRNDEMAELYERLTPDLINLIDFLKRFVQHTDQALKNDEANVDKMEVIYHQIMQLISTYEIGDDLESKTVKEVFGNILKENLLTGKFKNFIPPIIKCLYQLIYSSRPNLMIDYISELINNVRSHLEDLVTSTAALQETVLAQSTIAKPSPRRSVRSAKKVKLNSSQAKRRRSQMNEQDYQNLEFKIATIRVNIEELKDKLEECIKDKDFDEAKTINNKLSDLQAQMNMLHDRRCSIATDVSEMSMIIETEPNDKLSSTMIGDTTLDENSLSTSGIDQSHEVGKDTDKIFKHHTNELLKCLQMYLGCLQNVKIAEVPLTMLNHLRHLSYECLDEWFKEDARVRSLMVACNGLTALVDKNYAKVPTTIELLIGASYDPNSTEVRTIGFRSLADIICNYDDLEIPMDKVERFLINSLRDYDKYNSNDLKQVDLEFATAVVEGGTKLLYFKKLSSPIVLSHLILWWYHPTTHSKLKQFIGIFLPTFVDDSLKKQSSTDDPTWLEELLEETFVLSIEYLHKYILCGKGSKIMAESDMRNLINFLCNLIPVSIHQKILTKLEDRMDELQSKSSKPNGRASEIKDLLKYFVKAKNSLSSTIEPTGGGDEQVDEVAQLPVE